MIGEAPGGECALHPGAVLNARAAEGAAFAVGKGDSA
jgi:hypothetical protein